MRKNIMRALMILSIALFTSCTSMWGTPRVKEENHTVEQAREWDKTLATSIKRNAMIPEWYGEERPIIYLRKAGIMNEKEFKFLESLRTKDPIEQEDLDKFDKLVAKYNNKIEREFWLEVENIKDGKSLAKKIVSDSRKIGNNPSKRMKEVMDSKDWSELVALSEKSDLDEDDVDDLVDILNDVLEMDMYFSRDAWLSVEISERTADLLRLEQVQDKTNLVLNNLNAKAMYIAYSEYLSKMDRWDD